MAKREMKSSPLRKAEGLAGRKHAWRVPFRQFPSVLPTYGRPNKGRLSEIFTCSFIHCTHFAAQGNVLRLTRKVAGFLAMMHVLLLQMHQKFDGWIVSQTRRIDGKDTFCSRLCLYHHSHHVAVTLLPHAGDEMLSYLIFHDGPEKNRLIRNPI